MSLRDVMTTKAMEAGGRLTVRSALNPVLWLCAIVSVPSIVLLVSVDNPPSLLGAIAATPVALAAIGFLFLLVFDRDKLQSEDYQLRKSYLEMIEQKGDSAAVEAAIVEVIESPDVIAIPPSRMEDE